MVHGEPTPNATHDRLLVFGAAAILLGVVMVSQGVLLAQPVTDLVPREHAALMPGERAGASPAEPLGANTTPIDRVPPTLAAQTAITRAAGVVAAGTPCLDLDQDLRLVLATVTPQRGRFRLERPVVPNTRDVPTHYPTLARAWDPAVEQPGDCAPAPQQHMGERSFPTHWVGDGNTLLPRLADERDPRLALLLMAAAQHSGHWPSALWSTTRYVAYSSEADSVNQQVPRYGPFGGGT